MQSITCRDNNNGNPGHQTLGLVPLEWGGADSGLYSVVHWASIGEERWEENADDFLRAFVLRGWGTFGCQYVAHAN